MAILSKYKHYTKSLYTRKKKNAGRNNLGRITVAHQGGGNKQKYCQIDSKFNFNNGHVVGFEYNANRTAFTTKVCFFEKNKKHFFNILMPYNLKILDFIENMTREEAMLKLNKDLSIPKIIGNCYFLKDLAVGEHVYNIELYPNQGGQLVRAGGTSGLILQKQENYVVIKMPSNEHRLIPNECKAFLGNLANDAHTKIIWRKAGKSRWLNIRPTVRGVAKNPIDHPHGGNTSGGCHPVTPWAKLTKGKPTRSKKKKFINFKIV